LSDMPAFYMPAFYEQALDVNDGASAFRVAFHVCSQARRRGRKGEKIYQRLSVAPASASFHHQK
jgi:hypothetical protein